MSDCPKCGYPTKGDYKGVYERGYPCDGCGFVDQAVSLFAELLEMKLQDPSNIPKLLFYGAEYLKYLPSHQQSHQIRGCIKIMLAAKKEMEKCVSSTEQSRG